jgi:hypothetical protein
MVCQRDALPVLVLGNDRQAVGCSRLQPAHLLRVLPARPEIAHEIPRHASLQPDELNLLEDGLQLWLVALRNAPCPHADLLALFPNLVAAMERSTEHIAVGMKIAVSCVLLGEWGCWFCAGGRAGWVESGASGGMRTAASCQML